MKNLSRARNRAVHQKIPGLRKTKLESEEKEINGKTVKTKKRVDAGPLSIKSQNDYLKAYQHFCRWMVADRRAAESPIEYLQTRNASTDKRHERRSLEPDEIRRLLEATQAAGWMGTKEVSVIA